MAITPGTYNFTMQRRADYSVQLIFKDSTNTAINLNGYTVYAQCWDTGRTVKYGDFAITYTDRPNGKIDIALTDVQTATFLPNKLAYDVLLENPSGLREYYLEGVITMSEGYTSP